MPWNSQDSLYHHGILGQKWGVRRYQNEDGTLTAAGRERLERKESKEQKKEAKREAVKSYSKAYNKANAAYEKSDAAWKDAKQQYKNLGKTPIGRMTSVMKAQQGKGSDAAKKYLAAYDRASSLNDEADSLMRAARTEHEKLGKTYIGRVVAVAKYDR